MKQKWNLYAISCLCAILSVTTSFYLFITIIVFWLIFLYQCKRISLFELVSCFTIYLFFLYYIPSGTFQSSQDDLIQHVESITGRVHGNVRLTEKTMQFVMETDNERKRIMVITFIDNSQLEQPFIDKIGAGASCEIRGSLELPDRATNPYQFDYRQYLQHQGINYVAYVDKLADINCHSPNLLHHLNVYRQKWISLMTSTYDERIYPWIIALVFGDDQYLDHEIIQVFQRWGLSHILAISGLHIGIVVALVYFLFIRFSILTIEKAQWFILITLPIYAIIAGGQPSVIRASMMIVLFILLQRYRLKLNASHLLSLVFLILILWNRWIVYHVGFQLSFTVTFGLLVSRKILSMTSNRIIQLLQISFISQMMIIPLQIYYFYQFNPLSILLNLVIVPYFSIVVIPLMFFFVMTTWLPAGIHSLLVSSFDFIHQLVINSIFFLDAYVYYPLTTGHMTIMLAVIYYLFLVGFFIAMEKQTMKKQIIFGLLLVSFIMYLQLTPYFQKDTKITVLDIGQGDAIVIELAHRKGVFLIDAGAMVTFDGKQAEVSKKVYEEIIQPYLHGRGITHIDALFLSHDHVDHVGSVPYLGEDFSIGEIVLSDYFAEARPNWLDGKNVRKMEAGMTFTYKGISFHAVSPRRNYHDTNTNSLVLYTEMDGIAFLFTGDMTAEAERDMMRHYPNMEIDVLKVGHHGSDTSSSEAFLQFTNPKIALIPVGRNNRYHHPHDEIVSRLKEEGIHLFRTDKHGAIQLQIKNGSLYVNPYIKE